MELWHTGQVPTHSAEQRPNGLGLDTTSQSNGRKVWWTRERTNSGSQPRNELKFVAQKGTRVGSQEMSSGWEPRQEARVGSFHRRRDGSHWNNAGWEPKENARGMDQDVDFAGVFGPRRLQMVRRWYLGVKGKQEVCPRWVAPSHKEAYKKAKANSKRGIHWNFGQGNEP